MKRIASSIFVAIIVLLLVVQPILASAPTDDFGSIAATDSVLDNQPAVQNNALYAYVSVSKVERGFWGFNLWLSESLVTKLLSGKSIYADIAALNIPPWVPLVNGYVIILKSVISTVDRAQHRGVIIRFNYFIIGVIAFIVPGGVSSQ